MSETRDPSPAITRGLRILDVLERAAGNPQTLSDIARAVGIAKSSASNICAALEAERMIQRVGSGYRLGMRTAELGGSFALQFNQVREFFAVVEADPQLSEQVVQIATRDEADAIYLARHEGRRHRLGTPLGSRLPLVYCAVGTAMLLREDEGQITPLLRPDALRPPTSRSSRDAGEISARIRRAREVGYAVDRGESIEGVHGVAAPLEPWRPGDPPMAIGVALSTDEADDETIERIGAAVLRVAATLTNPLARRPEASA